MAQSKTGGLLVGGIFLLVGLGIFTGGLWSYVSTRNFVARASRVPGVVVALDTHRDSDGDTIYNPVFEFTDAAGKLHQVRSNTGSHPSAFEVGEKVEVLYESAEPAAAEINSFSQLWLLPTFLMPFGLVFALIGAGVSGLLGGLWRLARGGGGARGGGNEAGLTPRLPADSAAGTEESPAASDTDNPFARTDGPVRKPSDRNRSAGGFGSNAKY